MAYQSKYTGLQIDDILDSVEYKQDQIEDLESIRAGAAKGATALQSYTEKYTGTVTGIKINGTVKSGSGVIDLGTITTVTESTVSGWGFTKNVGTYSKPSGGIPKSDLASAVQTSLGKADTALQSYTEQYKGTITGVSANGTSVATSGVANIPAASTSAYGVTKLSSATNSTSTTLAATASAVKAAYDLANAKQDALISGTNIKTINGTSILGSGNIVISGGGGGSSSGSGAYAEVNHGTSDTTFTLTPNTFHVWEEVGALTLTLGSETAGVANEYLFQFTSGSEATTLSLPSDLKWANDSAPTIAENKIYQVSILKGLASVLEFNNAPSVVENKVTVSVSGTKYLVSLQYAAASDIVVKVRTLDGPISVSIPSGEISKSANPMGPMADSGAYIESIVPAVDTNYTYTW